MWPPMSIDDYARLEAANGEPLCLVEGVWWRQVRPFFYQPLFPFLELRPGAQCPPRGARLGGYQHLVPDGETANSRRNFFVWDDVQNYSLEALCSKKRGTIRKGMRSFAVEVLDDAEEFVRQGHDVYQSFFERTRYDYRKERFNRDSFAAWGRMLYSFPQVRVMGAWRGRELCAVEVSYLVNDILIVASLFAKTSCLRYQVVDALAHEMRVRAAACPDIRYIYKGLVSGHPGIDASKLRRGCKIITKPAWYRVNPLAHLFLRAFMPGNYRKLHGMFDIEDYGRQLAEATGLPLPAPGF